MSIANIVQGQNRKNLLISLIEMESVSNQAIIAVGAEIKKAKVLGITPRTLVIDQQINRIRTAQKELIRQTVTKGGTIGVLAEQAESGTDIFVWQSVGGDKVCETCKWLHGQKETLNEWLASFMPGDGQTICRTNCRCKLVQLGKELDKPLLTN